MKSESKQINAKMPIGEYEEFRRYCEGNKTSMNKTLRRLMSDAVAGKSDSNGNDLEYATVPADRSRFLLVGSPTDDRPLSSNGSDTTPEGGRCVRVFPHISVIGHPNVTVCANKVTVKENGLWLPTSDVSVLSFKGNTYLVCDKLFHTRVDRVLDIVGLETCQQIVNNAIANVGVATAVDMLNQFSDIVLESENEPDDEDDDEDDLGMTITISMPIIFKPDKH